MKMKKIGPGGGRASKMVNDFALITELTGIQWRVQDFREAVPTPNVGCLAIIWPIPSRKNARN